jgi:hypothetical protein
MTRERVVDAWINVLTGRNRPMTTHVQGKQLAAAFGVEIAGVRYVEVEPHSTHGNAIDALSATVAQIIAMQARTGDFDEPAGDLLVMDGRFYVPDGFIAKACETQGYVKRVIR